MNAKSIFKKLTCPQCRKWTADDTGKSDQECPKCRVSMVRSAKWYVRITRQGTTSLKAVSSRRQDAIDYLHKAKDSIRLKQLLPGEEKQISWEDAYDEFKKWIDGGNLAENTRRFYHSRAKQLDGFFSCPLNEITVRQVEEYRDMRLKTASPKTVADEIKALKRIFSLYCRWNSARVAPNLHAVAADLAHVEMPKFDNRRMRFLSEKEVGILLAKCKLDRLNMAIRIALATGLRLSNVMGLEWKQIDFINRTITFNAAEMKSKRAHVLPLMSSLVVNLLAWRKGRKKVSPYVFPSAGKLGHYRDMQTNWDVLMEECKFKDVSFHTLRHTFASHFLMNGGDLATLSELLDHSSIQITKDRYGHLSGEHKKRAIDQFEGVFFKSESNR